MLSVDHGATEPPFEQVRRQIAARVSSGAWPPGHRLPTVRALAADLGVAVNTVAKAYRALEADGVVQTRGRNGTCVSPRRLADAAAVEAAAAFARTARRQGLSRDEAHRLVDEAWAGSTG
ncbi:MAG TPA: GntR family transcriptional regulator [Aeromicrobium sp.]|nr:GntR family transcriptional regulator [Aeromicrobium sp.]